MAVSAFDIDRKLAVTAALVGARTRKDLAAAFRKVNPRTSFDIERANKWLQGRARPREQQIYDDWALLLDVGESGAWIADIGLDEFVGVVSASHGIEPEVLLRRARAFVPESSPAANGLPAEPLSLPAPDREAGSGSGPTLFVGDLAGVFACYSHAWTPYFAGRLIRSELTITRQGGGFAATCIQSRVQDRIIARGEAALLPRALILNLRAEHDRTAFLMTLFPPLSLISVLGGLVCGPAIIGVDPQPSVSRIVLVRLPAPSSHFVETDCLMQPGASIAEDLALLGSPLSEPEKADRALLAFLNDGGSAAFDHVSLASFRGLAELFDREWLRYGFPDA